MAILIAAVPSLSLPAAQLTPQEIAERGKWEAYLETAEVINAEQMLKREAVTSPWVLTLKKDGIVHRALWKNPEGRMGGFLESWKWEIAAYRMDKLLGLNMVPPTVEISFREERGSCQLWVESKMNLLKKTENRIETPPEKMRAWVRAAYLQQAFDNLIGNEDRHQRNVLITEDWRSILIDHSRSFRTTNKFTKQLIYRDRPNREPSAMLELPRPFYEKLKALSFASIREAVGEYLTDKEIRAVIARKDLIIVHVERRIKLVGEGEVLY